MQEIDYNQEGASADRFRKNFGKEDWLKVPRIYWDRTTSEVLTMEYCPGVKINRIEELDKLKVDRKRLARLAVESYLQQILTHGFFHAGKKATYELTAAGHPTTLHATAQFACNATQLAVQRDQTMAQWAGQL